MSILSLYLHKMGTQQLEAVHVRGLFMRPLVPERLQLLAAVADCALANMLPGIPLGRLGAL